jgi:hypothetical protein
VVLIRFNGMLSEADFTALDALGREKKDGPPNDVIFDMTAVTEVHLATEFVSRRGELPQPFTDRERIYVVPEHDLKLLVKLYAAYQQSKGWKPPLVVDRLEQAFEKLGVTAGDFQPVPRGT